MRKKEAGNRTVKFKAYREEIKQLKTESEKDSSTLKTAEVVKQNKHNFNGDENIKKKKELSAFDVYLRKNRIKKFLYILFVIVLITSLVLLTIYLYDKYLGLNLW